MPNLTIDAKCLLHLMYVMHAEPWTSNFKQSEKRIKQPDQNKTVPSTRRPCNMLVPMMQPIRKRL